MSAAAIKAFGVFTLALNALFLPVISRRLLIEGLLSWRTIIAMAAYSIVVTLVGIGLMLLRKWAALIFSLTLAALPIWMTVDSIGEVPSGLYLMMTACAIALSLPIIVIVRSWKFLCWRGKWFV